MKQVTHREKKMSNPNCAGRKYDRPTRVTKADAVAACKGRHLTLEVKRHNVGKWNESREHYVTSGEGIHFTLDITMKGDRPDWEVMIDVLNRESVSPLINN
jgi:hypothetical protein